MTERKYPRVKSRNASQVGPSLGSPMMRSLACSGLFWLGGVPRGEECSQGRMFASIGERIRRNMARSPPHPLQEDIPLKGTHPAGCVPSPLVSELRIRPLGLQCGLAPARGRQELVFPRTPTARCRSRLEEARARLAQSLFSSISLRGPAPGRRAMFVHDGGWTGESCCASGAWVGTHYGHSSASAVEGMLPQGTRAGN